VSKKGHEILTIWPRRRISYQLIYLYPIPRDILVASRRFVREQSGFICDASLQARLHSRVHRNMAPDFLIEGVLGLARPAKGGRLKVCSSPRKRRLSERDAASVRGWNRKFMIAL